jgi:hypothetical protein
MYEYDDEDEIAAPITGSSVCRICGIPIAAPCPGHACYRHQSKSERMLELDGLCLVESGVRRMPRPEA